MEMAHKEPNPALSRVASKNEPMKTIKIYSLQLRGKRGEIKKELYYATWRVACVAMSSHFAPNRFVGRGPGKAGPSRARPWVLWAGTGSGRNDRGGKTGGKRDLSAQYSGRAWEEEERGQRCGNFIKAVASEHGRYADCGCRYEMPEWGETVGRGREKWSRR